jgi:uncharacterized protein YndB with AHSA1/START domain
VPKEVKPDPESELADRELVITRVFDAPRELVFDAFTDPKLLMSWWGPRGCSVISCETDPIAGGTWRISMRSPRVLPQFVHRYPVNPEGGPNLGQKRQGGRDTAAQDEPWIVERQRGVYREVVKPERLVFTGAFEDDEGRPRHQTVVTVTFSKEGDKTKLTLHQAVFPSVSARDDHVRGWTEALEHLAEYLMQR